MRRPGGDRAQWDGHCDVRGQINAGDVAGQQIVNQATATFVGQTLGASFTDTSPQVTNTVAVPDLTIVKSHTGSFVGGVATTFTLAVSNVGTVPTDGSTVTVSDPFPPSSFSSIANAGGSGWSCAIAALTLTCTRSDVLAAGTSYPPILVDATVPGSASRDRLEHSDGVGRGLGLSSGSDGGGASGLADVSITKSAAAGPVASGGQVTYTLNVRNAGPSAAQNVMVSDPLGTGSLTAVSVQTSQPGELRHDGLVLARDANGQLHGDDHDHRDRDRPRHDAHEHRQRFELDPGSEHGQQQRLGERDSAPQRRPDDHQDRDLQPRTGPDSFTVTVSNNGPDTASGVVVNDSLPSQFTATGASGGGFTCTLPGGPGGTLVCTLATLAVAAGPQQIVDHRHARHRHGRRDARQRGDGQLEHGRSRPDQQHRHVYAARSFRRRTWGSRSLRS